MSEDKALIGDGLKTLIRANEPYWGGEAEVIRSYWDSPVRNRETDKKWLTHQIYKEYWDGILPPLESLNRQLQDTSVYTTPAELLQMAELLFDEVQHFSLFTDLYALLDGKYALSPDELKLQGAWSENDDLMRLRKDHKAESPELGRRAYHLTEGGHCALFAEGMKLAGRGAFDDSIAEVCSRIYEDEFNHLLLGIVGADDAGIGPSGWDTLVRYTVEQMKLRIVMRNAQFSRPVSEHRLGELLGGFATPMKFNFKLAKQLSSKQSAQQQS